MDEYSLPVPEFDTTPASAHLDDKGQSATYVHKIANALAFQWRPSSSPVIMQGELSLTKGEIRIRFRAPNDTAATKQIHRQIVDAVAGNVAGLAREIPGFNANLPDLVASLIAERKRFCDNLERRRNELF